MENAELPETQNEGTENRRAPLMRTEFDELVRRALLDVNAQEFERIVAQADTIAYTPSPHHLAWEQKFLADLSRHASGSESTGETSIELEAKCKNEPLQEDGEG